MLVHMSVILSASCGFISHSHLPAALCQSHNAPPFLQPARLLSILFQGWCACSYECHSSNFCAIGCPLAAVVGRFYQAQICCFLGDTDLTEHLPGTGGEFHQVFRQVFCQGHPRACLHLHLIPHLTGAVGRFQKVCCQLQSQTLLAVRGNHCRCIHA